MKFIGRQRELEKLWRCYSLAEQSAILLYGRRRVGKSELLKYSLEQSKVTGIYYECKQTSEKNNVASLAGLIADKFNYPPLAFAGMEELLEFVFQRACREELVLVLDEYTYLRDTLPGCDSILQYLLDKYKDSSHLKLVLCGSFIDTMKSLLAEHNPLYGRISLTIALQPMDYYESALFYPDFSPEDKVRLYSVFGGIPYYNRLIRSDMTVQENIIELIASPGARLENEVSMYLHSELAKLVNANEIFEAMAKGYYRYSDILAQSHVSSSQAMADVLKKLMQMELVAKEAPINDENNKKKAGYVISDNMARFYYRYIFRYSSQLRIMPPELFYQRFIAEDWEREYVPKLFEGVCRQYLIRQNLQGKLAEPFFKIGKYYYDLPKEHRNGEFDVVTEDARGYIFYEAKFRSRPLAAADIRQELAQVQASGMKCYRQGFFARSGFAEDAPSDIIKICLADLYK